MFDLVKKKKSVNLKKKNKSQKEGICLDQYQRDNQRTDCTELKLDLKIKNNSCH